MKVTTSPLRACDKVNKIVPILQEYFGSVIYLTRNKLLAFVIHALCVVQTVNLHKIASAKPTSVEHNSNRRRLQRYIAGYAIDLDLIAIFLFELLPVRTGLILSLDRTNWKYEKLTSTFLY